VRWSSPSTSSGTTGASSSALVRLSQPFRPRNQTITLPLYNIAGRADSPVASLAPGGTPFPLSQSDQANRSTGSVPKRRVSRTGAFPAPGGNAPATTRFFGTSTPAHDGTVTSLFSLPRSVGASGMPRG
jgi:hypothetical protein